jgi:hypothetical protein
MQKYFDAVLRSDGRPAVGATIAVTVTSTGLPATLYSDNGITPISSTLTADASGEYSFYAANNSYTLTVSYGGYVTETKTDVTLFDVRKPFALSATAAPASTGSEGSITTAFNGDLSKCQFPIKHQISGVATAGQPASGYSYTHELFPHYTYLLNQSGWNNSTSGNAGRTGICAYRTKVDNYGQGDLMAYNATGFVSGTKAGSTNFLANPAVALFAGDMNAGSDGVYLNLYETIASDYGYDVACFGIVNNFNRTNATGAKSTVWGGYRAQSVGTATCDAMISGVGKWVSGLDFAMTGLDFGTNQAAISLRSGQRIYFNNAATASGNLVADYRTTAFNGDYIAYGSGASAIVITAGGVPSLQVGATQISSTVKFVQTANFQHTGTGFGVFGAPASTGQATGWGTPTGNAVVTNFPGATATLAQCSQTLAQIILQMKTFGFFGA